MLVAGRSPPFPRLGHKIRDANHHAPSATQPRWPRSNFHRLTPIDFFAQDLSMYRKPVLHALLYMGCVDFDRSFSPIATFHEWRSVRRPAFAAFPLACEQCVQSPRGLRTRSGMRLSLRYNVSAKKYHHQFHLKSTFTRVKSLAWADWRVRRAREPRPWVASLVPSPAWPTAGARPLTVFSPCRSPGLKFVAAVLMCLKFCVARTDETLRPLDS